MKAIVRGSAALVPVLTFLSLPVAGQDLTLFQDTEGGNLRAQFAQAVAGQAAPAAAPTMVLKGIYRFGDTYHVTMQSGEGAVYKTSWQAGQANGATVNGYQIQVVDSRTVTMSMPAGMSCQQSVQGGSNCVGRGQMALTFAESEPVLTRRGGAGNRGNNNNAPNFGNNNNSNRQAIISQLGEARALFEAANGGDDAARAALQELIGNRGRGGRGGFNGGNNGGGNNAANGGGNNGGNAGVVTVTRGGFGGRGGNAGGNGQ